MSVCGWRRWPCCAIVASPIVIERREYLGIHVCFGLNWEVAWFNVDVR